QVYRSLEGRSTEKIFIENEAYFIKKHSGVGWKEIFKNLFQFRLPILSAKNEKVALTLLPKIDIPAPTLIAYGKKGWNPAKIRSYILTRELPEHISLEHFCANWRNIPPNFLTKQRLIKEVARIARIMHGNGMNHRDFYICHFLLDIRLFHSSQIKLYLIDLHRAGIRKKVPLRWLIKDLAGLYFSSKDIGLTQRDLLRFMKEYRNKSLSDIFQKEDSLWRKVEQRGNKLYGKHSK
ncbi:MAG TPA: lipopolysaccharide core heptose(I) kinase RfaP, partial [Gammaproteobacteria bacterium]|nr:lipopolysaccharide core heptose(I) kinase RfaP [Gammaproteobacteria bacterium]